MSKLKGMQASKNWSKLSNEELNRLVCEKLTQTFEVFNWHPAELARMVKLKTDALDRAEKIYLISGDWKGF